jgi:hypothetical protein
MMLTLIGKLCGASFINEKFEKKLLTKLGGETDLVRNGKTLKSIAQAKTTTFENSDKRTFDVTRNDSRLPVVYIDDLRPDSRKQFFQNNLELKR